MARPWRYTPTIHAALVKIVRAGNTIPDAARILGLDPDTVNHWLRTGREAGTGRLFRLFVDLRAANAKFVAEMVRNARRMARGGAKLSETVTTRPNGAASTTTTYTRPEVQAVVAALKAKRPREWGEQAARIRELEKKLAELEKSLGELGAVAGGADAGGGVPAGGDPPAPRDERITTALPRPGAIRTE